MDTTSVGIFASSGIYHLLCGCELLDRNGNFFEAEAEEIVARCFCHEIEHLDGHLFTEHADRLYTTEELDRMMEEQGE